MVSKEIETNKLGLSSKRIIIRELKKHCISLIDMPNSYKRCMIQFSLGGEHFNLSFVAKHEGSGSEKINNDQVRGIFAKNFIDFILKEKKQGYFIGYVIRGSFILVKHIDSPKYLKIDLERLIKSKT